MNAGCRCSEVELDEIFDTWENEISAKTERPDPTSNRIGQTHTRFSAPGHFWTEDDHWSCVDGSFGLFGSVNGDICNNRFQMTAVNFATNPTPSHRARERHRHGSIWSKGFAAGRYAKHDFSRRKSSRPLRRIEGFGPGT